jgi:hypothetical protein
LRFVLREAVSECCTVLAPHPEETLPTRENFLMTASSIDKPVRVDLLQAPQACCTSATRTALFNGFWHGDTAAILSSELKTRTPAKQLKYDAAQERPARLGLEWDEGIDCGAITDPTGKATGTPSIIIAQQLLDEDKAFRCSVRRGAGESPAAPVSAQ